jgi:hypothetical protein
MKDLKLNLSSPHANLEGKRPPDLPPPKSDDRSPERNVRAAWALSRTHAGHIHDPDVDIPHICGRVSVASRPPPIPMPISPNRPQPTSPGTSVPHVSHDHIPPRSRCDAEPRGAQIVSNGNFTQLKRKEASLDNERVGQSSDMRVPPVFLG